MYDKAVQVHHAVTNIAVSYITARSGFRLGANRLPDSQNWVGNGGIFIAHDRFVSSSVGSAEHNPLVLGEPDTLTRPS